MNIFTIGRLCVKLAGRDAGNKCIVVDELDNNYVLIDGNVRRKKVNVKHLEPLDEIIEIKKGASHEDVKSEFKKLKYDIWEKKSKEAKARPKKQRKVKVHPEEEKKGKKGKKEEIKEEKEEEPVEESKEEEPTVPTPLRPPPEEEEKEVNKEEVKKEEKTEENKE